MIKVVTLTSFFLFFSRRKSRSRYPPFLLISDENIVKLSKKVGYKKIFINSQRIM